MDKQAVPTLSLFVNRHFRELRAQILDDMLFNSNSKRILGICILLCCLCSTAMLAQGMSDLQVLEYVKGGMEQGKSRNQITVELTKRGVTQEQMRRVYESRANAGQASAADGAETRLREEVENTVQDASDALPQEAAGTELVFGRNIFNTKKLSFEPNMNIATPPSYRLGPGDEVIIDIWGTSQNTIRQQISPEGTINISMLGPLYLSGMTVSEANAYMKKALNKIYSGVNSNEQTSGILLTLGQARTIRVNVMGEVVQPGTYALSSFSTVFHALYRAGGVSDIGSLRNIQLVRDGRIIVDADVYDFIMKGKIQNDIHLEEGDVLIVPPYKIVAKFEGKVKRPMKFEMRSGETLAMLIHYAGGFEADAYTRSLHVVRQNGEEYEVNTVREEDYSSYPMRNGDVVTAGAILNRFTNKLEIRGAVYRPGIYQLSGELNTVRELVTEAKGLRGDAFPNRALLQRQHDDLTTEIIRIDIMNMMKGGVPDVALRKDDILYIPGIHDLEDKGNVVLLGEVEKPDSYPYAENMTLEDLIIQAGGLREAASTMRVDVARRIKDPKSLVETDSVGRMFTFSLKDGFVIDGEPGFVLQPYDQVYVRRSPGYQVQQNVTLEGEVLFGGNYAITGKEERASDLIAKAGGVTRNAYLRGAKLMRKANADEKKRMQDVVKLMTRQLGEQMVDSLNIHVEDFFTVGISLDKALATPGCEEDIILREGDVITIPRYINTVKVNGAVMMPNTIAYLQGKNIDYYLNQAGGYGDNARKRKAFIIYMNGQITRVKGDGKQQIEPGCEIVIPSKKYKNSKGIEGILGYATTFGSLGLMIASLANLLK